MWLVRAMLSLSSQPHQIDRDRASDTSSFEAVQLFDDISSRGNVLWLSTRAVAHR